MVSRNAVNFWRNVQIGWTWFSQITAVVGLISIFDDLKSWGAVVSRIAALLFASVPALNDVFVGLGQTLHMLVLAWRSIAHPLFHLLFGWLPLAFPPMVIDIFFVVVFFAGGVLRSHFIHRRAKQEYEKWRSEPSTRRTKLDENGAVVPILSSDYVFEDEFWKTYKKSNHIKHLARLTVMLTVIMTVVGAIFIAIDILFFGGTNSAS